jgi:ribosomal protein S18
MVGSTAPASHRHQGTRPAPERDCALCRSRLAWVDYKDVRFLGAFMNDRGRIRASRVTGNCAQHQVQVALAIKTARELALLPHTQRTASERSGRGRGPGGARGPRPQDRNAPLGVAGPAATAEHETVVPAGADGTEGGGN